MQIGTFQYLLCIHSAVAGQHSKRNCTTARRENKCKILKNDTKAIKKHVDSIHLDCFHYNEWRSVLMPRAAHLSELGVAYTWTQHQNCSQLSKLQKLVVETFVVLWSDVLQLFVQRNILLTHWAVQLMLVNFFLEKQVVLLCQNWVTSHSVVYREQDESSTVMKLAEI